MDSESSYTSMSGQEPVLLKATGALRHQTH
ncbi:hypothetical protein CsSME_00014562 [Camellia sinensis var. sinensis]